MANRFAMPRKRILVAWIGHRICALLLQIRNPALKNDVLALVKGELLPAGEGYATAHHVGAAASHQLQVGGVRVKKQFDPRLL
jgi:hypothetical protein